jgi:phosphopantothenoylcysteine decarboxylase/phosphopantothenate--cysteine ligase
MRLLITAGPTREHIDPVRFLSNCSTGKMGFAIAEAAIAAGHEVELIAGPVSITPPAKANYTPVVSARDMLAAVMKYLPTVDAVIMTAAVADWRPAEQAQDKLKKHTMEPVIKLVPNPDILSEIKKVKTNQLVIGFAAETRNALEYAKDKLERKGLDMIVANDVSQAGAGFAVETNIVSFITRSGIEHFPLMSKLEVGKEIIKKIDSGELRA